MAGTNASAKWYVCPDPQNSDLTQSEYEGLSWVRITSVSDVGEMGKTTNMLNYPTWDDDVVQKAKGLTDAGSPTFTVVRLPYDEGQNILRAAGAVGNNNNYAFKEERADALIGGTGTVIYNRGLVSGPTRSNGGNEDFDTEVFTLGFQQEEVVVKPTLNGVPPKLTAAPAITGTAQAGETLTCSTGTFSGDDLTYSYQWFADGVLVNDKGTKSTYVLATGDVGKVMQCRVTARNVSGYASGFSNLTDAVTAAS